MKKLLTFLLLILLFSCKHSEEVIVENVEKPKEQSNKSYTHEFAENEIVYLKPDSIPCAVYSKRNSDSYDLIILSGKTKLELGGVYIDTSLIFPKRLK
jgi:hypothetical protein